MCYIKWCLNGLKDRRGRQWQTTPGLKNCLGNPDTGSPGVYSDSKELLLLLYHYTTSYCIISLHYFITWLKYSAMTSSYKQLSCIPSTCTQVTSMTRPQLVKTVQAIRYMQANRLTRTNVHPSKVIKIE